MTETAEVLFVCTHNAGRSQMARSRRPSASFTFGTASTRSASSIVKTCFGSRFSARGSSISLAGFQSSTLLRVSHLK